MAGRQAIFTVSLHRFMNYPGKKVLVERTFIFKDTKRSRFLPQGWHGGVESNTSAVQMRRER
jgi:hypothetical protein